MRRRAEYLVEKRDGRREWLRATKLARSILLALSGGASDGAGDVARAALALRLASGVLAAARRSSAADAVTTRTASAAPPLREEAVAGVLTTQALATAVVHELLLAGAPQAAQRYVQLGLERRRRKSVLHELRLAAAANPSAAAAPATLATRVMGARW